MKTLAAALLAVWFLLMLVINCIGCATVRPFGAPRPLVTYRCALDEFSCHLVASAAVVATAEGFPTARDDRYGSVVFLPGEARTVFFGCEQFYVNAAPMAGLGPVPCGPPVLERHGAAVIVNALPNGVQVRNGELVGYFADELERGRKQ